MSNILIIKHGSLGDIAQASGAIQDISEYHKQDDLYLLSTQPYYELLKKNPYIKDIIIDKRKSRFNLFYLYVLMKKIKKFNFIKVYDLQNSNRTNFYKKILFPNSDLNSWCSTETTLPKNKNKNDFNQISVLERFKYQLNSCGVKTNNTLIPDFSWSCVDISSIKKKYKLDNFIILFPFSSPHLKVKRWPYYNELIYKIRENYSSFKIVIAPGPNEIHEAKNINAETILNLDNKPLNISELSSLIKDSLFVISNDTGPAHISAHLNKKGLALFGSHTTAIKAGVERKNFKAIQVSDLNKLTSNKVFQRMQEAIT